MAEALIATGITGVDPKRLDLVATPQDLELKLPIDLTTILEAFKNDLAISNVQSSVDELSELANPFCFVEWAGMSLNAQSGIAAYGFNIFVGKHRTAEDMTSHNSFHIDYSLHRIKRLLLANPFMGNQTGISGIEGIDIETGGDYQGIFNDPNLPEGKIQIRYFRNEPNITTADVPS